MKRAIVSVINDLATDQRVHRHCLCLADNDFQVQLVGRKLGSSAELDARTYATHRFNLPFERGPLFYATYNIRLFFFLLFSKVDLLFSNDLDTLLPNYLVSKMKGVDLIYDSHEFFSEVPEIQNRPSVKRFWQRLESAILPRLKWMMTVNDSIAKCYKDAYNVVMRVHRNLPMAQSSNGTVNCGELGVPVNFKMIVLQGAGINVARGAEEAVEAMRYIEDAKLMIIGSGDVIDTLKKMAEDDGIKGKVIFKGKLPYEEMMKFTHCADLALSLDKDTNLNYRFSLPNKLFDYIQAGTPVLASDLPEVSKVINDHGVGWTLESHDPQTMAEQIKGILANDADVTNKTQNCTKAASTLTWENERRILDEILHDING